MSIEIKPEDLQITTIRPEGMSESYGVEVRHLPTGIVVREWSSKAQHLNRSAAFAKLELKLAEREKPEETKVHFQTKVHYQTKAEIWQYLLDGGTVRRKGTRTVARLDCGATPYNFDNPKDWEPFPEPKPWYENIPEKGILCWVSDKNETQRLTWARVTGYFNIDEYAYNSDRGCFKYATPVKLEEIQDLIYKPEQSA